MKNKGFTLIELLVVIVIIGILATVSTATFTGSLEDARKAKSIAFFQQVVRKMNASPEALQLSYDFEDETNAVFVQDGSGSDNDLDLTNKCYGYCAYSEDTYDSTLSSNSLALGFISGPDTQFETNIVGEKDFTFALWAKTTGQVDSTNYLSGNYVAGYGSGAGIVSLQYHEDQSVAWHGEGGAYLLSTGVRIDDEKWHSIVVTRKGKVLRSFIDGEDVYSYIFSDAEYSNLSELNVSSFALNGPGFRSGTMSYDNVYFWADGFSLND